MVVTLQGRQLARSPNRKIARFAFWIDRVS